MRRHGRSDRLRLPRRNRPRRLRNPQDLGQRRRRGFRSRRESHLGRGKLLGHRIQRDQRVEERRRTRPGFSHSEDFPRLSVEAEKYFIDGPLHKFTPKTRFRCRFLRNRRSNFHVSLVSGYGARVFIVGNWLFFLLKFKTRTLPLRTL
jgi:hypothetical protein